MISKWDSVVVLGSDHSVFGQVYCEDDMRRLVCITEGAAMASPVSSCACCAPVALRKACNTSVETGVSDAAASKRGGTKNKTKKCGRHAPQVAHS